MPKDKRDLLPHRIDVASWWYEERGGITVVVEPDPGTRQIHITWRALLNAARRCGALEPASEDA